MTEWDALQARFRAGNISRREFLGRAAALGISTALATRVVAQVPKRGGRLVLGIDDASSGDSLDPARYVGPYISILGQQMYDQLTRVDERGKLQTALAESWETKAGAREWVFKLRKGVVFHNGKELTAADVVYSINHHRGKDSKSPAKALLATVTDVRGTGRSEVTMMLNSGNADMPYLLADHHLGIGPEGSNFTDGVGTGAFMLESFEPGVRARTKRNPNDYRSDRGFADSVETLGINDPTARLSALQSGSIHMMNRVPPVAMAQLEKHPEIQTFNISSGGHHVFAMRCDAPPFDNDDLRLALKYAVDREALLKTVLRGFGKVGNDQPIPSFDPFHAADIPQRPYDPERAKFHFKKSGYSGPIALSAADVTFSGALEAVQVFQASAAKTGIALQVDRVPSDGYWTNVWRKKPFVAATWAGRPTADIMFATTYKSDAPWNETSWKRPKFDEVLIAARAELNTARRKQMYRELQLMVHEDGGTIIPMFYDFLDAALRKVRGFVPAPTFQMSGYRAPEKVWLDG
jgi:peptide/nickel transport system substrate-binding protein